MLVKDWIALLNKIPPETEIEISVDISTGEHDSDLRVFATEFVGYQEPGSILLAGSPNYPITANICPLRK